MRDKLSKKQNFEDEKTFLKVEIKLFLQNINVVVSHSKSRKLKKRVFLNFVVFLKTTFWCRLFKTFSKFSKLLLHRNFEDFGLVKTATKQLYFLLSLPK